MAERLRKLIGNVNRFAMLLEFSHEHPLDSLAWGELTIFLGGQSWLSDGKPICWTLLDLAEWLAKRWRYLLYESSTPEGFAPFNKAKATDEEAFYRFGLRHDLSTGFKGIYPPELWIVPQEVDVHLEMRASQVLVTKGEFESVIVDVVETILSECAADTTGRADDVRTAWANRVSDENEILKLSTGLSPEEARDLLGEEPPEDIMAAARLSVPLSLTTRRIIFEAIREVGTYSTQELDKITQDAKAVVASVSNHPPFEQGYTLALWLRERLGVEGAIHPETLLNQWEVPIRELPAVEPTLDAAAVWGDRGPAVFINPKGRHVRSKQARRATLAHEIAHLVMDRGGSLPFAEVMGGNTPRYIEQRARAFAAEILLPRSIVAKMIVELGFDAAVNKFASEYVVSRQLIGWQINNSNSVIHLTRDECAKVTDWVRNFAVSPSARS